MADTANVGGRIGGSHELLAVLTPVAGLAIILLLRQETTPLLSFLL